jgi:hypothetical protein
MLLPFASGLNPPPPPPLVPRADVVFSLQRAGADAVFSFQFPVASAVAPPAPSTGAGLGAWPYQQPVTTPRKTLRELQEAEAAAEIADAAVARARAFEQPQQADTATPLESLAPVPESLARLSQPLDSASLLVQIQTQAMPAMGLPSAAMLDEDAILAASMLLMRRRKK